MRSHRGAKGGIPAKRAGWEASKWGPGYSRYAMLGDFLNATQLNLSNDKTDRIAQEAERKQRYQKGGR